MRQASSIARVSASGTHNSPLGVAVWQFSMNPCESCKMHKRTCRLLPSHKFSVFGFSLSRRIPVLRSMGTALYDSMIQKLIDRGLYITPRTFINGSELGSIIGLHYVWGNSTGPSGLTMWPSFHGQNRGKLNLVPCLEACPQRHYCAHLDEFKSQRKFNQTNVLAVSCGP